MKSESLSAEAETNIDETRGCEGASRAEGVETWLFEQADSAENVSAIARDVRREGAVKKRFMGVGHLSQAYYYINYVRRVNLFD